MHLLITFLFSQFSLHQTWSSNNFLKFPGNTHCDCLLGTCSLPSPFHCGKRRLPIPLRLSRTTWLALANGILADATWVEAVKFACGFWLNFVCASNLPWEHPMGVFCSFNTGRPQPLHNLEASPVSPKPESEPPSWAQPASAYLKLTADASKRINVGCQPLDFGWSLCPSPLSLLLIQIHKSQKE